MKRTPQPALTDPRQPWQITQGARCACRGTDDYCACQNVEEPWKYGLGGSPPPTREQELEVQVRRLEGHIETLTKQQQTDRQTIASLLAARALLDASPPCEGWRPIASAPKDGQHILACRAGTSFGWADGKAWPPVQTVVHWWGHPGEEGFYTSVNELEPQAPFAATHWKPLDAPARDGEG